MDDKVIIGVVGPCAAGKTTLISKLKARGYKVIHIAQEHSCVPDMWLRMTNPHVLIYLDVSYKQSMKRKRLNWTEDEFLEQVDRLRHARKNADIYVDTNDMTPDQVFDRVIEKVMENV